MTRPSIRALMQELRPDPLRRSTAFTEDLQTVNDVLWHPWPKIEEQERALLNWLQRKQPCLFGRVAAIADMLHVCIIEEADLFGSESDLRRKIQESLVAWKRRSLSPNSTMTQPAHGYLLCVVSPQIATASPDLALRRLAERILEVWGCAKSEHRTSGETRLETLYLQHPTGEFSKFTFTIDFFAAQGDGRWWHDHRIPGGFAFTANSVGHMKKYRELYAGSEHQLDWVLRTAMRTIAGAADTPYGRATWLMELRNHKPYLDLKLPSAHEDFRTGSLAGRDWTRYSGHLHTDQCLRPDFFHEDADVPPLVRESPWLEDFSYLYDENEADHGPFVKGESVTEDEVVGVLGRRADWPRIVRAERVRRTPEQAEAAIRAMTRVSGGRREWEQALRETETWRLTPQEVADILAT